MVSHHVARVGAIFLNTQIPPLNFVAEFHGVIFG
jgi:hypothetical protein